MLQSMERCPVTAGKDQGPQSTREWRHTTRRSARCRWRTSGVTGCRLRATPPVPTVQWQGTALPRCQLPWAGPASVAAWTATPPAKHRGAASQALLWGRAVGSARTDSETGDSGVPLGVVGFDLELLLFLTSSKLNRVGSSAIIAASARW